MDAELPVERTLRPWSGVALSVFAVVFIGGALAAIGWEYGLAELPRWCVLGAAGLAWAWLLFWLPVVKVGPSGVVVRNPLRTYVVTWPAVQAVETRYALTLITRTRRIQAWAAPAGGRYAGGRMPRDDRHVVPTEHRDGQRVTRPSDLTTTESGLAAHLVRTTWERLRGAGWLKTGKIDGAGLTMTWNLVGVGVTAALTVAGLVLAILD